MSKLNVVEDARIKGMMSAFEDQPSQDPQSQVCNPTHVAEQAKKT